MADNRLAAIQMAFGAFGGAFNSLNSMITAAGQQQRVDMQTDALIAQQDAQELRTTLQNEAAADILSGRGENPERQQYGVYRRTAAEVRGQRHGMDLATRWTSEVFDRAPAGADLRALTNDWVKENVGRGSGDPIFDRTALSTLFRAVDMGVTRHRGESVRATLEDNSQALNGVIGRSVQAGSWGVEDVGRWVSQARTLNPHEPQRAQATVTSAILAATPATPAGIERTLSILRTRGSGPNGMSFFEANPQAGMELETQLNNRLQRANTVAGSTAWTTMRDRISTATTSTQLTELLPEIETLYGQHGGQNEYAAARRAVTSALAPLRQREANVEQMRLMATGGMTPDPSFARQNIDSFLQALPVAEGQPRVSLLTQPDQVGRIVARLGAQSDVMQEQARSALANFNDPEAQKAAFRYYRSIETATGSSRERALSFVSEEQRALYRILADRADISPEALDRAFSALSSMGGNDARRAADAVPLHRLLSQQSQAQGETRRRTLIQNGLNEWVGQNSGFWNTMLRQGYSVRMDADLEARVNGSADSAARVASALGSSVDNAVTNSVKDLGDRIELRPGADGAIIASLRRTNADRHADGEPVVRGGVAVTNPSTGQPENTLRTSVRDLSDAQRVFGGFLANGGRLGLGIDMGRSGQGLYPVVLQGATAAPGRNGDGPVYFELGGTVNIDGKEVRLPTDMDGARTAIQAALPASMQNAPRLVLAPVDSGRGLQLFYRYGFTERGATAEQQEVRTREEREVAGTPVTPRLNIGRRVNRQ
ncbi:hypothetical protein [Roseococcus pinisoli]|uniref:Uncharacterized protein n=1 Tax=Roseococcus pinisoli TaxID=2835040 RepID=A0ABS5QC06_9PROT|nr:hypothetical protein [Roseococcus pinisoli]MBS7811227.1 hypothetical protein [Roseococcus pinisoli]